MTLFKACRRIRQTGLCKLGLNRISGSVTAFLVSSSSQASDKNNCLLYKKRSHDPLQGKRNPGLKGIAQHIWGDALLHTHISSYFPVLRSSPISIKKQKDVNGPEYGHMRVHINGQRLN